MEVCSWHIKNKVSRADFFLYIGQWVANDGKWAVRILSAEKFIVQWIRNFFRYIFQHIVFPEFWYFVTKLIAAFLSKTTLPTRFYTDGCHMNLDMRYESDLLLWTSSWKTEVYHCPTPVNSRRQRMLIYSADFINVLLMFSSEGRDGVKRLWSRSCSQLCESRQSTRSVQTADDKDTTVAALSLTQRTCKCSLTWDQTR